MSSLPADLTPEQTAALQERMRLARETRIHQIQQAQQQAQQAQQTGRPINMFSMQNGVGVQNQNLPNGFGSFPSGAVMNGMSSTSAPTQNQNFGAGGTGGE
jgi:type II secretory pathway pseudopilin PulG